MDRPVPRAAPSASPAGLARGRADLALGFALLALAGGIDGIGFVRWSELYVSFMSGNTAQFGAAPAVADWGGTARAARALALFVVGVVAAEAAAPLAGRWRSPAVVTAEAALLWLAAAGVVRGWGDGTVASIAGLAMGVQTAALHRADGVSVALTYVTGTLVNLGRGVAAALRREAPWSEALPFAGFWLSLAGGAAAGSFAARAGLAPAMASAAGFASLLAVFAGAVAGRRRDGSDGG